MDTNDLSKICKVAETHSSIEANDFLDNGWKLINLYTASFSIEYEDQVNIYVLGQPEENLPKI